MSVNLPDHFVQTYTTNVNLLLQQKGSKLRGTVSTGSHVGKQASVVDQVGAINAQRVTSRFAPMSRVDAALDRRWVFPVDYDLPQLIDTLDKLRTINELSSPFATNANYAMGRAQDTEILAAFFGTAKTGEQGATSTIFTAANEIDVAVGGTNSRINVEKLIQVKELAMANQVDLDNDPLYCGITAKDNTALLGEIQIISADFNGGVKPVLQDGKVMSFLGINFIHCELIETALAGTNEVTLPVWAKSGMYMGSWAEVHASVDVRADLQSKPFQLYTAGTFGATRLDEKKVFAIESYRA